MKPVHIYIENFMNHIDSDIDCSLFESALIIGKNKNNDRESNGLGKSTIFNAIEYALFNAAPTSMSLESLIHDSKDKCKVIFTFESNNGTFRISRSRGKRSDVELDELVGGEWVSRSGKTATATDKAITKIIGLNHKTFKYSVLFAQGDEFGLASATPEARRGMLKEPLNLSVYNKFEKAAKESLKEKQQEIASLKLLIGSIGDPDVEIEAAKLNLSSVKTSIEKFNGKIESNKAVIAQKRSLLSTLEAAISSNEVNVLDKLSNITNNIKNIRSNLDSIISSINDSNSKKAVNAAKLKEAEKDLKALKEIYTSLSGIEVRNLSEIESEIKKAKNGELKGIKYVASLEAKFNELNEFFLPDSDECPYCKQDIAEDHRKECESKVNADIKKVNDELDVYRPKLVSITKKKQNLENELIKLREHVTKVERTQNQISSRDDDIENRTRLIEQLDDMLQRQERLRIKSQSELDELVEQEKELSVIAEKAMKQKSVSRKISWIKEEINDLEIEINGFLNEINKNSGLIGSLEEKINNKKEDKKKLIAANKKISDIEKESLTYKRLAQAFGSTGIPALIISTILDDLQVEANALLTQIKPELELQFHIEKEKNDGKQAETLEITYRVHGRDRTYYQLSGAQKLVVALSLKLGLSQVIQHRLGVDIKFLALDEVDQSLDEAGIESLFKVIKEWEKKFKIFVITHNNTLRYRFKHIIEVVGDMENGVHAGVVST